MAMGKRKRDRQPTMWVTTTDLPTAASHPFYRRLNKLLLGSSGLGQVFGHSFLASDGKRQDKSRPALGQVLTVNLSLMILNDSIYDA